MKPFVLILAIASLVSSALAEEADYERAPIEYSKATPNDPVAQLIKRLERGEASIEWETHLGFLPSVLRELKIPVSSQGLVFSRTSLQRNKISPRSPRAIYFNDDAYVGFVQPGGMLEIAAADPKLGAVFYTIAQTPPPPGETRLKPAQIVRKTDDCLSCHGSGMSVEIPGLTIRSMFTDSRGNAIPSTRSRVKISSSCLARPMAMSLSRPTTRSAA